jgi:plastocyanin
MSRALVAAIAVLTVLVAGCASSAARPQTLDTPAPPIAATVGPGGVQAATIDGTNGLIFSPNVVRARVGTIKVTLRVTGSTPHTLTFAGLHLDTGYVAGGTSATLTIKVTKPGAYPFTCDYHPFMTGTLQVSA